MAPARAHGSACPQAANSWAAASTATKPQQIVTTQMDHLVAGHQHAHMEALVLRQQRLALVTREAPAAAAATAAAAAQLRLNGDLRLSWQKPPNTQITHQWGLKLIHMCLVDLGLLFCWSWHVGPDKRAVNFNLVYPVTLLPGNVGLYSLAVCLRGVSHQHEPVWQHAADAQHLHSQHKQPIPAAAAAAVQECVTSCVE
jgi:hypothetical protein